MIENEYEIISHNSSNFRLFLVNLIYRTPHIHKDFEISLVLDGSISLSTQNGTDSLLPGDIFIMNPFIGHEITAKSPALIMSLQIPPVLFSDCYPQADRTEFDLFLLSTQKQPKACSTLSGRLYRLAEVYFGREDYNSIQCMILVSQIFLYLLQNLPHRLVPEREKQSALFKGERMRKIMHYIDAHYTEKILLSDIAEKENLDLYYLSHFFKDAFGVTFQKYVSKIRCEHARQLLLLTDHSLLDVSISCGFSDAKYFNKAFRAQYGCTPKEYRRDFQSSKMEQQQKSMLTTQEFLSEEASLVTLDAYSHISRSAHTRINLREEAPFLS